jgi:hypothetical protein
MILVKMYYHSYLEIFIVDKVTFVAEDVASTKSNSDTRLILSSCCQVAILSLLSQMSHLRDSNVNYDLNWFGRCVDFQFEGGRCTVLLDLCDIVMLIVHRAIALTAFLKKWLVVDSLLQEHDNGSKGNVF